MSAVAPVRESVSKGTTNGEMEYTVYWEDGFFVKWTSPKWLSLAEVRFLAHCHLKDNEVDYRNYKEDAFERVLIIM